MTDLGIGETFFSGYRSVDQVQQDMRTLAQSALATLVDYGDSYAKSVGGLATPDGKKCPGYDLLALKITNGASAKPPFIVVAGMHAREILQAEIALRFARHLVYQYDTDSAVSDVVDSRDIYIIPACNPDALWTVANGGATPYLQRKNLNPANGTGTWPPALTNHTGVDLNRNFSFKWSASVTAGHTSTTPSDENYKGPSAASEPETQALATYLGTILTDVRGTGDTDAAPNTAEGLVVSMHSYAGGGIALGFPWAWTTTNCPNAAHYSPLATRLAAHLSYNSGQWADLLGYSASGTFEDYVYGTYGVAAILIESTLRSAESPFLTPYTSVATQWPAHRAMLMDAASVADLPYQAS